MALFLSLWFFSRIVFAKVLEGFMHFSQGLLSVLWTGTISSCCTHTSAMILLFASVAQATVWEPPLLVMAGGPSNSTASFTSVLWILHLWQNVQFYLVKLNISKWSTKTLKGGEHRHYNLSGKQFHKLSFYQQICHELKIFTSTSLRNHLIEFFKVFFFKDMDFRD